MGVPPGESAPGSPSSAETAATPGLPGAAAPAGAPASQPGAVGVQPATGDARVDEAVARLADLAGLPLAEHPPVFEYVQERLTEALGDLDVHDPAGPGSRAPGPRAPGG